MRDMIRIAELGRLPEGVPTAVQACGVELLVIRDGRSVTVFQGTCPHQGALLAQGTFSAGVLTCPGHGWCFDCASGLRTDGTGASLRIFSTTITEGSVLVARDELDAWQDVATMPARPGAPPSPARVVEALPRPRGLPVVGNLFQLRLDRLHLDLEAWARELGPIYALSIAHRRVVVVADSAEMLSILRDRPDGYRRLRAIQTVNRELGIGGVFSAEGDTWRRQRRLVAAGLDHPQVRRFFPLLNRIAERLRTRWLSAASAGRPIDAQPDLVRFAVDVTTNFVFDCDMNTLERGEEVFQQHLTRVLPTIGRRVNALFPYWRYWKLPADHRADQAVKVLQDVCRQFIERARERLRSNPDVGTASATLLEALLRAEVCNPAPLTEEEIFANSITMLLAGEDTTASTLAWIIHFLARHPDMQQRARTEIDAVASEQGALQDSRHIDALHYVDGVVCEALRLKPPAPVLYLEANRDSTVAGTKIPAGTRLMLLLRAPCLQSEHFTDAAAFRPERWLTPRDTAQFPVHDRSVWMPFGAGPRFCPGHHLAWLEMKTAVAMICRNFDVTPADTAGEVGERFVFTMMPSHACVYLTPRAQ